MKLYLSVVMEGFFLSATPPPPKKKLCDLKNCILLQCQFALGTDYSKAKRHCNVVDRNFQILLSAYNMQGRKMFSGSKSLVSMFYQLRQCWGCCVKNNEHCIQCQTAKTLLFFVGI